MVGWENIIVAAVQLEKNRWMEGKSCQAITDELKMNPIDMICDLLSEEKLAVTMISFYGSEEVLEKVLTHAHATLGSDGIYGGRPHPRLYGTYPRFIKRYVREKKMFTLPEAIKKITSFPAQILGISDRGVLSEGQWADIVLFDPEKIDDTATYQEPISYPEGIPYVFVNGKTGCRSTKVDREPPRPGIKEVGIPRQFNARSHLAVRRILWDISLARRRS